MTRNTYAALGEVVGEALGRDGDSAGKSEDGRGLHFDGCRDIGWWLGVWLLL